MPADVLTHAFVAGLIASVACGLGALPLAWRAVDPSRRAGVAYAAAGGLMVAASVYNLLLPALDPDFAGAVQWPPLVHVVGGLLLGALALAGVDAWHRRATRGSDRRGALVFFAMTAHSVPEGVAVGVAYATGAHLGTDLGFAVALAIAIHNIPEGLAVAIPLRAGGASIARCFVAAFLTSLPQPLAALPAAAAAWFFQPLMPSLLGFAAGAMLFLVVYELLPDALEQESRRGVAWAFTIGLAAMLLIQIWL